MSYVALTLGKMAIELVLAFAIKLFCTNGRINVKDLPALFGFGPDIIVDGFTLEMAERGQKW